MLNKKTVTFVKKNSKKKTLMIKIIVKLEIIVIIQVNSDVLDIACLI